MNLDEMVVRTHPGDGLVGRFAGVALVVVATSPRHDAMVSQLLALAEGAAATAAAPGRKLARHVAGVLGTSEPDDVPPFGLLAQADDGLVLILHGAMDAEVQWPQASEHLSGGLVATWVDRILPLPIVQVIVAPSGPRPATPDPRNRLLAGVVSGAGLSLLPGGAEAVPATPAPGQPVPEPDPWPPPAMAPPPPFPQPQPDPWAGGQALPAVAPDPWAAVAPGAGAPLAPAEPPSWPFAEPAPWPGAESGAWPAAELPLAQPPPAETSVGPTPAAEPAVAPPPPPAEAPPAPEPPAAPAPPASEPAVAPPPLAAEAPPATKPPPAPLPPAAEAPPASEPAVAPAPLAPEPPVAPPPLPGMPAPPLAEPRPGAEPQPVGTPQAAQPAAPPDTPAGPPPGSQAPPAPPGPPGGEDPTVLAEAAPPPASVGEEPAPPPVEPRPFIAVALADPEPVAEEVRPPLPIAGQAPSAFEEPAGPRVRGVICSRGHFNDPAAPFCGACGISMVQRTLNLVEGPRPPLGVVVFDDGTAFTLDSDYVMGREPENDPAVVSGAARPLAIVDPDRTVSRVHANLVLDGWNVKAVDRGSANGTFLAGPGDDNWVALIPNKATAIKPGTRVRLGQRILLFDSHQGIR